MIIEAIPYRNFKEKIAITKTIRGVAYIEKDIIITFRYEEELNEGMLYMR